jgi:hypothetical protein
MTASDALSELAERARVAEDRVTAAMTQARSDVQKQVDKARKSAQKKADSLQGQTAKGTAAVSQWWTDVHTTWSSHVAQVRHDVEDKRTERDTKKLQRRADAAEGDAVAAVAFAEAALEEAEYAVLDAALARMELDEAAPDR